MEKSQCEPAQQRSTELDARSILGRKNVGGKGVRIIDATAFGIHPHGDGSPSRLHPRPYIVVDRSELRQVFERQDTHTEVERRSSLVSNVAREALSRIGRRPQDGLPT